MIRVALPFTRTDNSWMGGVNYLVNLVRAVATLPDPKIEFVLLLAPEAKEAGIAAFPSVPYLTTNLLSGRAPLRVASKGMEILFGRNFILEHFLKKNNISAISHASSLGQNSSFPAITWIPDFQHIHLPQFFTEDQIKQRQVSLIKSTKGKGKILLSSEQAQKDFTSIAPQSVDRTRILRFVSGLEGPEPPPFDYLRDKYGLDEKYFHLPNQFWQHKNHDLVASALNILARRGLKVQVVCTGHTDDFRHPEYFGGLKQRIDALGVADSLLILGVVPYADVRGLMRNAVAVLNPSHFEGWSTSVEESKSMGKTVLLSDIPVHREQAPAYAGYFNPNSPEQLADQMERSLQEYSREADEVRTSNAKRDLNARYSEFARSYESLIVEMVNKSASRSA